MALILFIKIVTKIATVPGKKGNMMFSAQTKREPWLEISICILQNIKQANFSLSLFFCLFQNGMWTLHWNISKEN